MDRGREPHDRITADLSERTSCRPGPGKASPCRDETALARSIPRTRKSDLPTNVEWLCLLVRLLRTKRAPRGVRAASERSPPHGEPNPLRTGAGPRRSDGQAVRRGASVEGDPKVIRCAASRDHRSSLEDRPPRLSLRRRMLGLGDLDCTQKLAIPCPPNVASSTPPCGCGLETGAKTDPGSRTYGGDLTRRLESEEQALREHRSQRSRTGHICGLHQARKGRLRK
jgi:hypothetical protein